MELLEQLSSQTGERTGNTLVASKCIEDNHLLKKIADGLSNSDNKIIIDCTEVMTEVAKIQPQLIVQYVSLLPEILDNKNNRARWESMHSLALIAEFIPKIINSNFDRICGFIENDKSVIVRDYALDALSNYGSIGKITSKEVYPILIRSMSLWDKRHSKKILIGLTLIEEHLPEKKSEILAIAEQYISSEKASIKQAAKRLQKKINKK